MKLMNIQAKLKLHKLRNKIALLQLRETWKPAEKKVKCPFCQSMAVYRGKSSEAATRGNIVQSYFPILDPTAS
jgi:hypothetical protein